MDATNGGNMNAGDSVTVQTADGWMMGRVLRDAAAGEHIAVQLDGERRWDLWHPTQVIRCQVEYR